MSALAVVTGGSVGIGAATVATFVGAGLEAWSLSRRTCPVGGARSLLCDLATAAGVDAAIAALLAALPESAVIHLVHNAAAMEQDRADALDPARFERAMRLNVVTPAQLSAALIPRMAPGSSITFVGSTLSEKAVPGRLSYVASKHAIVGLMRATVQDLFGRQIHATCVCPGFTDTEMLRPVLDQNPGLEEAVCAMVSFGRLLAPQEIADVIAFAARTPALNGAVLHANLGQRES
ncbi:MAG: SDR family oxidoreductase [Nannocystaceae bacterium]